MTLYWHAWVGMVMSYMVIMPPLLKMGYAIMTGLTSPGQSLRY